MSNENSKVEYESGVTPFTMRALTDSGDHKVYNSEASIFSEASGDAPVIRPNGILTGGSVIPVAAGTDNVVTADAISCNLNGVETAVPGGDLTIARAASDVGTISSITVTAAGALAVIQGTDSADQTVNQVRGTAGGPPYIPTDSIEVAQVCFKTDTDAVVAGAEILATPGTHKEVADFPVYDVKNFTGKIVFDSALPTTHTGDVAKAVHASYAKPSFTEQKYANDFVPADTSFSTSSEQVYSATLGSSSSSLGQASFTAILKDGITDNILAQKGKNLMIRYYQDRYKLPHIITQGKLGLSRTFGASDNPKVTCTISPTVESENRAS